MRYYMRNSVTVVRDDEDDNTTYSGVRTVDVVGGAVVIVHHVAGGLHMDVIPLDSVSGVTGELAEQPKRGGDMCG